MTTRGNRSATAAARGRDRRAPAECAASPLDGWRWFAASVTCVLAAAGCGTYREPQIGAFSFSSSSYRSALEWTVRLNNATRRSSNGSAFVRLSRQGSDFVVEVDSTAYDANSPGTAMVGLPVCALTMRMSRSVLVLQGPQSCPVMIDGDAGSFNVTSAFAFVRLDGYTELILYGTATVRTISMELTLDAGAN